jgi:hypothetical protein
VAAGVEHRVGGELFAKAFLVAVLDGGAEDRCEPGGHGQRTADSSGKRHVVRIRLAPHR